MKLEVGMTIYFVNDFGISRYKITRVTDKQAMIKVSDSSETKFVREVKDNGDVTVIGKDEWSRAYYALETPELIAKYRRQKFERSFGNIDVKKLSDEQLVEVLKLVGKETQKE